jgi:RNA polymerase sigma-70 factor (ECF subfamily)
MIEKNQEDKGSAEVDRAEDRTNEQVLIQAVLAGDRQAFGQIVRRHQKRLFRFVYGLLGDFDQAEDIVQDAFVKAYGAMRSFEAGRDFYPWLSTIARNLALNLMARERRKESLDQIHERGFDPASSGLGPLEQLTTSESQQRFYAALKALPEQYRTVFVLRHFEEMSYEDIAAQLKIPPGTVDSRLYRARQLLVKALKDLL